MINHSTYPVCRNCLQIVPFDNEFRAGGVLRLDHEFRTEEEPKRNIVIESALASANAFVHVWKEERAMRRERRLMPPRFRDAAGAARHYEHRLGVRLRRVVERWCESAGIGAEWLLLRNPVRTKLTAKEIRLLVTGRLGTEPIHPGAIDVVINRAAERCSARERR